MMLRFLTVSVPSVLQISVIIFHASCVFPCLTHSPFELPRFLLNTEHDGMGELRIVPENHVNLNPEFIVDDTELLKNSSVYLSPVIMNSLHIWYGAVVLVEGKAELRTACTVLREETEDSSDDKIRMNKVVRNKLGVSLGDRVSVNIFGEVQEGNKILVRPLRDQEDKREFARENFFEAYLKPYFFQAYRPVHEGDIFEVTGVTKTIKFQVLKTDPSPFCIVVPATIILCEGPTWGSRRKRSALAWKAGREIKSHHWNIQK